MQEVPILVNKAMCKRCGTILVSLYRHHFDSCACGNSVDGGLDYLKRGGNPNELEEMSEFKKEMKDEVV